MDSIRIMQNVIIVCVVCSTFIFCSVNAVSTKTIETLKIASHQGNDQAAFNLGNIYANGIGVSVDAAKLEGTFKQVPDREDILV